MVGLRPMTDAEFEAFRERSVREYGAEHVRAGQWAAEESEERASAEFLQLLPQGAGTADHYLQVIVDGGSGARLGEVWYCLLRPRAGRLLFLYLIGDDAPFRRRGVASGVLTLLEAEARRLGAGRIGLHVFGDNTPAQALYARMGYAPTNILMAKALPP